jgi:hypothetical protein
MAKFMIRMEVEIEAKNENEAKLLLSSHIADSLNPKPMLNVDGQYIDIFGTMVKAMASEGSVDNPSGYINIFPIEAYEAPEMIQ